MEKQVKRLYEEDIGSGRPTATALGIIDSAISKRFPKYRRAKEITSYLRDADGLSIGERLLADGKGMIEDYTWRKIRNLEDKALAGATDFFFGKGLGERVRGSVYDYATENIVDMATRDYLNGHSPVKFIPAKYGSKELRDENGEKLLGKFRGNKAWIAEDVENALGHNYEPIRQEAGMTKEQFDFIVKSYIELHESNENIVKKMIRSEMPEDAHAKFESNNMKSLYKYRGILDGADEIYRVGMAINKARTDGFGRSVQKYLREDMLAASLN